MAALPSPSSSLAGPSSLSPAPAHPQTPRQQGLPPPRSGALSGLASAVVLQPLDLIKTRVQQGSSSLGTRVPSQAAGTGGGAGLADIKGKGKASGGGIGAAFRAVVREEGVAGLWRGTVPTIVRNVPGAAAYFYLLSEVRHGMSNTGMFTNAPIPDSLRVGAGSGTQAGPSKVSALPMLTTSGNLLAGALARTSVGFVFSPVTVLKARFESNLYARYTSLPTAFLDLVRTSGVRGLFQGFTATALRDAPYAGLYVVCYEEGKAIAGRLIKPEWGIPYAAIHTVSGMSAAAMATLATSPADCIKTRMQVLPEANPSLRAAIRSIYRDRGFAGFLSGASLRISRKAASSAIGWTVYEGILLFMRDRERERERLVGA